MSIIEYLSKKANKAQDNADSHAVKTHLPNGIRVVDLNTVADLTNFPQEVMKIVHHHGIPKHLYFRLVLHLVETAKKHKDAHSSVLAAVANLNKDQLYHANVLNDKGEEVACPHEPKGNGYKFAKARWAKEAGEKKAKAAFAVRNN